jgi:hypothetical protein
MPRRWMTVNEVVVAKKKMSRRLLLSWLRACRLLGVSGGEEVGVEAVD